MYFWKLHCLALSHYYLLLIEIPLFQSTHHLQYRFRYRGANNLRLDWATRAAWPKRQPWRRKWSKMPMNLQIQCLVTFDLTEVESEEVGTNISELKSWSFEINNTSQQGKGPIVIVALKESLCKTREDGGEMIAWDGRSFFHYIRWMKRKRTIRLVLSPALPRPGLANLVSPGLAYWTSSAVRLSRLFPRERGWGYKRDVSSLGPRREE